MTNVDPKYEFQAPQFHDFLTKTDVDEAFCQEYFDNKTKEMEKKLKDSSTLEINISPKIEDVNDKENLCPKKSKHKNSLKHLMKSGTNLVNLKTNFSPQSSYVSSSKPLSASKPPSTSKPPSSIIPTQLMPVSPCLHTKIRAEHNTVRAQTTEEIEIKHIETEKQKYEELKQLNAKNLTKIKENSVFQPVRSMRLTIPISPSLQTEIRAQQRQSHQNRLRSLSDVGIKDKNKILKEDKINRKRQRPLSPINSQNTPNEKKRKHKRCKITIPQSFKISKTNSKIKHPSTQDIELDRIKDYGGFKAREYDKKGIESNKGSNGVPHIKTKLPTIPCSPALKCKYRAKLHKNCLHNNIENITDEKNVNKENVATKKITSTKIKDSSKTKNIENKKKITDNNQVKKKD